MLRSSVCALKSAESDRHCLCPHWSSICFSRWMFHPMCKSVQVLVAEGMQYQ
jgi:hypothetical protein